MKELGIYVHIPFCKSKCNYCDFVSFPNKEEKIDEYIRSIKKEISSSIDSLNINDYVVTTIYIGGGTPSSIDSKYIVEILEYIRKKYNISENIETTIEINPGTVSIIKIEDYKKARINRVSIGLQSTNNNILKSIGRIHSYEQFIETYMLLRKLGFKNINVDLMIGLPEQTIDILKESINKVIDLKPEHISVYSLIIEENTKIYDQIEKKEIRIPEEEKERLMYWYAKNKLELNGYNHYEISNFCKEKYESKHNMNCWNQKEYLGFGLAAHSYFNNTRFSNTTDLNKYIKYNYKNYMENKTIHETQNKEDKEKEYMLLGLRKIKGVNISEFKHIFTENPIYIFKNEIDELVEKKLLEVDANNIKLTEKGIDLANLVWEKFV